MTFTLGFWNLSTASSVKYEEEVRFMTYDRANRVLKWTHRVAVGGQVLQLIQILIWVRLVSIYLLPAAT